MRFRSVASPANIALIVLGGVSAFLYVHSLEIEGEGAGVIPWFIRLALIQGLIYTASAWIAWKARGSGPTLFITVAFAALFRLSLLFAPPLLSDDVYRYVWDGRVQAAGINPYRYIPADESLKDLRDTEIYPKINRREYAPTIYPPGAEVIFFLTTRISQSVTWMKATMVGFEALTIWALTALLASFGVPRQRVLIYAWHPLAIWEFAGSGHLDALAIAFLVLALLARRRDLKPVTGLLLAGATLVKLYPALLFPVLYRRWDWRLPAAFAATTTLAYVPYLGVGLRRVLGYLPGYLQEEGMTSGSRFFLLAAARRLLNWPSMPDWVFVVFGATLLLGLALWSARSRESNWPGFVTGGLVLCTAFTALLSPRYSWYFTWLIPFLCFVPALSVYYLTAVSFILYGLWVNSGLVFELNLALYLPFAVLAGIDFWMCPRRKEE
jgi:hypothetical protein